MSRTQSIEANQEVSVSENESLLLKQFTRILKRVLIVIYLVAVLFSAIVVPMFRESILTAVKSWLGVSG